MENVFMTTTERKRMSTKTTFKRIALVAVAALGLGVLSVAPSSATINATDVTLTATSPASVAVGETATSTIVVSFIGSLAFDSGNGGKSSDSVTVVVTGSGAGGTPVLIATTDSSNVKAGVGQYFSANGNATVEPIEISATLGDSMSANAAATFTKGTFTLNIKGVTTTGTYPYTAVVKETTSGTILKYVTFNVTVTAANTDVSTTYSKSYVNGNASGLLESDSSIVASAGSAATPVWVGRLFTITKNSADTNVVSTTGAAVADSVTVVASGPGLLGVARTSTLSKQVTMKYNDSVSIWSDGTAGTLTLSTYIGTTISSTYLLTQTAKTVTFTGKAVTLVATETAIVTAGGKLSSARADSVTVGSKIVTFTAKDSAGNAVTSAALNQNANLYAISSDTKVVAVSGSTVAYKACTHIASGTWGCDMVVMDSGTATITIADSFTVASSTYTSNAVTIRTASPTGYYGTIETDKTTYAPGELAVITVKSYGRDLGIVGQSAVAGTASNPFTSIVQNKPFSSVKTGYGFGSGATGTAWDLTDATFVNGVETYVVYMPVNAGTVTLTGYTKYESSTVNTPVSVSISVVDPTKDAADAATDAALEATDAAYAAQDAAQLAAEAADAATAAAEAATAAVEDLATQVASLFNDLQKQITTLANVVAKIAKKVKA